MPHSVPSCSPKENLKQVYCCFNLFLVLRPKKKFFPILPFWAQTVNTEHVHWPCWLQLQLCCRHHCSCSPPSHKILISAVCTRRKKISSLRHSSLAITELISLMCKTSVQKRAERQSEESGMVYEEKGNARCGVSEGNQKEGVCYLF